MKTSEKKLVGLRRYHVNRPVKTRLKLLEALDRMESGHTVVVGPGFNWSKMTLAREAGVNVNTVVRKMPGGFLRPLDNCNAVLAGFIEAEFVEFTGRSKPV